MSSLFECAYQCLRHTDPVQKVGAVNAMGEAWQAGELSLDADVGLPELLDAGRPERPELRPARDMPRRRLGSPEGQAAMIHAIGHIEFNAINLACDAVYRYHDMPREYYDDWVQVAVEEACHYSLIAGRLESLGYHYGDFPAHDGLWDLARRTAHDPLVRMALIPRVMEARGLDVTPDIMRRFREIDDQQTVAILEIILRDEIGHVAAGSRWFNYLCEQQHRDPEDTYFELLERYFPRGIRCPLHVPARLDAGFTEHELERLESLCIKH